MEVTTGGGVFWGLDNGVGGVDFPRVETYFTIVLIFPEEIFEQCDKGVVGCLSLNCGE